MNEEENVDDGVTTDEFIASYVWSSGHLSAAYYNTTSLEMYITHEAVDLKPDFWHLKNLFRQIKARNVLASGPTIFLKEVMRLMGLPSNMDPNQYRLNRAKSHSAAEFIVYSINEKTLLSNRRRILELHLPRMASSFTEQDRYNFIETLLPLHQDLIVQSLGNLLNYLDANWKHISLRDDNRPVISQVQVYHLESQMLIDEATFNAMQIFAPKDHPSAFKKNTRTSAREGLSFFGVMNSCVSRIGSDELKSWLQQPSRDFVELNNRYDLIEWCRNEKNITQVAKLKGFLRNVSNVGELYMKLANKRGKPTIWRNLKKTLYYAHSVGVFCAELLAQRPGDIKETVIKAFGKYAQENETVSNILTHIDIIVDLNESLKLGRFCVRYGLDTELDQKKDKLHEVIDILSRSAQDEIRHLPEIVVELTVHFVSEMGFLVAFPAMGLDTPPDFVSRTNLKYVYKTKDAFYFHTPLCLDLNEKYGHLYTDICERESQICDRLLEHIHEYLADLQFAVRFCAKLDCAISLAAFAIHFDLVRPNIVTDRKVLEIVKGRHILLELQKKCVPSDVLISVEQKNLINILIAPNASGKSIYMKTLAQIVYLAHIGSFVPAQQAQISLIDAIYTKIYYPETLYQAKSSFLTEIQQTGNAITNSSTYSLILIDELGQGTNALNGKALLLACLEHLISRGEKSPIAIVSTHYIDVYDQMVDKEWVVLKTFEMIRNTDGSLSSTYRLIDGKCTNKYARDCAPIKEVLKRLTNTDTSSISNEANEETRSENIDGAVMMLSDQIYRAKVNCAFTILSHFVRRRSNGMDDANYAEIFNNYSI